MSFCGLAKGSSFVSLTVGNEDREFYPGNSLEKVFGQDTSTYGQENHGLEICRNALQSKKNRYTSFYSV